MLITPLLTTLLVSAAASLQSPLDEIRDAFEASSPDVTVTYNFGGSNALARQIENGAPADILLTAGPIQGIDSTPFLSTTLVLIVRRELSFIKSITDLTSDAVQTIALANPATAPAGIYTAATLDHFKLTTALAPRFVLARDVRQVLTYVATGNADAGFVYATDVTDQVHLVTTAPADSHPPITYQAALIQDSFAARAFLDALVSESGQATFLAQGFTPLITHQPSSVPSP